MVTAGDSGRSFAQRLGIHQDQIVQELGWDEDSDDDLRANVEEACGSELLDEDADEVIDVVLLWWRDGDGDLVDRLMDAIAPLAEDGVIWVLTPKISGISNLKFVQIIRYIILHFKHVIWIYQTCGGW